MIVLNMLSTDNTIKKHCQMVFDDGIIECGYLVGGYCKSDPKNPVRINKWVHDALKVVGCASWSKYLEWNHVRTNTVPELPVKQVGDCGNSKTQSGSIEGRHPLPVHILQEGNTVCGGGTREQVSPGCDMMTPCDICGEQSVVTESDGHHYCLKHHEDWTKCISHEKMVKEHKK